MAAKLAVGYTLDQIANDITQKTPASFEPSIDYVVTKIPRFAFEKFPGEGGAASSQDRWVWVAELPSLMRVRSTQCGIESSVIRAPRTRFLVWISNWVGMTG